MALKDSKKQDQKKQEGTWYNPVLFGKPVFPSSERTLNAIQSAFTPVAGTPPPTMAGVSIPPAGASFSQLQFRGPLISTGSRPQQPAQQTPVTLPSGAVMNGAENIYASQVKAPPISLPPAFQFNVASTQIRPFQPSVATLTGQPQPFNFQIPTQSFAPPQQQPPESRARYNFPSGFAYLTPQQEKNVQTAYAKEQADQQRRNLFQSTLAANREYRRLNPNPQEQFFAQKRAERLALGKMQEEAVRANPTTGRETARRLAAAYQSQQPSTATERYREFARMNFRQPVEQRVAGVMSPLRSMFGLPAGGPQPASQLASQIAPNSLTPFSNFNPFSGLNTFTPYQYPYNG